MLRWLLRMLAALIVANGIFAQKADQGDLRRYGIPMLLQGEWRIAGSFDASLVSGLSSADEKKIEKRTIFYSDSFVPLCGKRLLPESVQVNELSEDTLNDDYGVSFRAIGLDGPKIHEILLGYSLLDATCGLNLFPGTHVFVDDHGHATIEVENEYFRLEKISARDGRWPGHKMTKN